MQGSPLLRQQILLQHLGQQRVQEPVPAVSEDVEHAAIDRLPQQPHQLAADSGRGRHRAQLVRPLRPAGHGDQPGQRPRRRRQAAPGAGRGVPQLGGQTGRK